LCADVAVFFRFVSVASSASFLVVCAVFLLCLFSWLSLRFCSFFWVAQSLSGADSEAGAEGEAGAGVAGRSRGGSRCLGFPGGEVLSAFVWAFNFADSRGWVALPEGLGNMPALVDPAMWPPDGVPALRGWGSSIVVAPSMSGHVLVVFFSVSLWL
jgi:hypothetical protein